ncbi:GNAT family N-acetyltransferase [Tsukamurella sp. 8F]|uniref:GNAT family N-acetyltransferase n=1 Tax=unclassified Tsukamurella TaxID=2633480 RepID=UPI0023B9AFD9|nr:MULTISPECIES: GNAT family N-acetyltransferase [unclassified Tsukamurella]MDF0529237.1 GNAT family N-acetyltransferase [Tsukamurella sp. 8J]MDF0585422.1 GNAT family N-acetyltransferase [Tsukamurella sp. 8F]
MTTACTRGTDTHVLDDPVTTSLHGAHARFRIGEGSVVRYDPQVTRFVGFPRRATATDWAALARIAQADERLSLRGLATPVPPPWTELDRFGIVQFDGAPLEVAPDPDAVRLGGSDVPEILDLVERTRPGPFTPRTIELGTYLGIRRGGRLVAMAGERLHPPGWTEISAVCTHPDFRGQGLATRLIRAVGQGIRARGELPFLHTAADNAPAIALYERLGFVLRSRLELTFVGPPAGGAA